MNGTTHYVSPAMASWRSAEEADGHGSIASDVGDGGLDPEDYGTVHYTAYETSDSPEKVLDFYKTEFKGWKEESTFSVEKVTRKGEVLVWSKDDGDIAVWMVAWTAALREETTSIVVAVGAR